MPFTVFSREEQADRLPAGRYRAVKVEVISRDEHGYPIFKPSAWGELRATLAVSVENEPVRQALFSDNRSGLMRLARAFGVDIARLPDGRTTEFLLAIEKAINASGQMVDVVVGSRGWVSYVPAIVLPEGFYKLSVVSVTSLDPDDKVVTFRPYEAWHNALAVMLRFRIEGVLSSDETLWDGYTFRQPFGNPFAGTAIDENGLRQPRLSARSDGQKSANAMRLEKLLAAFWPDGFDYVWVEDPQRSVYRINEVENPIAVIADRIVSGKRIAAAPVKVNEKGYANAVLEMLQPLDTLPQPAIPHSAEAFPALPDVRPSANPFLQGSPPIEKAQEELLRLVEKIADKPVFRRLGNEITPVLTDDGIAWAKQQLVPVWDRLDLPQPRRFGDLSYEQCKLLYAELSKLLPPDGGEVF